MRLINADALYDSYIHEMDSLIKSTVYENAGLESLSLLCGAKLITDAPTIGGWISVKDRLPEDEGEYLVFEKDGSMDVSDYFKGEFIVLAEVTHWMPLPEPPKEGMKCE